jgi:hypothetical protein
MQKLEILNVASLSGKMERTIELATILHRMKM